MKLNLPYAAITTALALGLMACSPGHDEAIEGSMKYRVLNENQFLIEASGHWLTSNGMCADEVVIKGLRDIKLGASEITMNGGTIEANWQQIDDLDPLMRQIRRFSSTCDAIDEVSINVAFLQLQTGPIKQVVAVSEQRHMFIVEDTGEVSYWRPFKDVSFATLDIVTEDLAELTDEMQSAANVDYELGDEDGRFTIGD